jgi:hypothetical protein
VFGYPVLTHWQDESGIICLILKNGVSWTFKSELIFNTKI